MVVERSRRQCLLCGRQFAGRAFVCRPCSDQFRDGPLPEEVLRRFYQQVDLVYPDWANTYGNYNPPNALLEYIAGLDRDLRVLEIGAGGGFLLNQLWTLGFQDLVGSDITMTSLRAMSRREAPIRPVGADAESLPFLKASFDIVVSSDVVEHLPRVNSHLSEVHRVLRPGGRYLLKTPNRLLATPYYRARGLYDSHIWHPSMFSPGELHRLLVGYGFRVTVLRVNEMTDAQLRKIPNPLARSILARFPIRFLPVWLRPHLEVVAELPAEKDRNVKMLD